MALQWKWLRVRPFCVWWHYRQRLFKQPTSVRASLFTSCSRPFTTVRKYILISLCPRSPLCLSFSFDAVCLTLTWCLWYINVDRVFRDDYIGSVCVQALLKAVVPSWLWLGEPLVVGRHVALVSRRCDVVIPARFPYCPLHYSCCGGFGGRGRLIVNSKIGRLCCCCLFHPAEVCGPEWPVFLFQVRCAEVASSSFPACYGLSPGWCLFSVALYGVVLWRSLPFGSGWRVPSFQCCVVCWWLCTVIA